MQDATQCLTVFPIAGDLDTANVNSDPETAAVHPIDEIGTYLGVYPCDGRAAQYFSTQKREDYGMTGLHHVGLYPDFIADLTKSEGTVGELAGGSGRGVTKQDLEPLFLGAEAYVQSWERAWWKATDATTAPPPVSTFAAISIRQSCNDGNLCTFGERKNAAGDCGGGTPYTCAPAAESCEATSACNGAGACITTPQAKGFVCRPRSTCDIRPETCDGSSTACPPDLIRINPECVRPRRMPLR